MKCNVSKGLLMTALITGSVMWGGTAVFAEENLTEYTLDQMVVTATRTEKRDVEVPASTTILSTDDLKKTGGENLQVALGKVPGLIYKTFGASGAAMGTMANEIAIRGVSNGTLVMLNGVPMNLRGKYYLDAIPVESVEKVEIIKGSGSVLYGSEAMGGVINIITKKAYNNSATVGFGNYGQQKYAVNVGNEKVTVGYNIEKWGSVDNISKSNDKGPKHVDMPSSHKNNLFLNYNINDNWSFLYNYFETNAKYNTWFDDKYKSVPVGGALQQNREYVSKQNMVQVNYKDDTVKGSIYYNQNKLMADGFTNYTTAGAKSGATYDTDEKNRTYGADIQKLWNTSSKGELILGTSYQNEFYDDRGGDGHKKERKITDRNVYAVYGQYDHKFDDRNEFILGARETWTTAGYKDQNYDNFSMSGQYLYKISDNDSIYANVSQSFIMPTFSQMYGSSEQSVSNPDLKPQKGTNYEIGWKRISGNHTWKAAIYHMDIEDNITSKWDKNANEGKGEYQYTNQDFRNTGVEISCDIKNDNGFSYNWGINYMNPEAKDSGAQAKKPYWDRSYGRIQLTGGIGYTVDKWDTYLQGTYLGKRVASASALHSVDVKPYFLTSLTTTYKADKQNFVSLVINNLLNRDDILGHTGKLNYSGSEYYSTPTNFLLTYTYNF